MDRRILALLTVVLLAASSSPAFARSDSDFFYFPDGTTLSGSNNGGEDGLYTFDALRVPPDSTLFYSDDVIIEANDILIEGNVVGKSPTTPGTDGPSIVIRAKQSIIVYGTIRAASGTPATLTSTDGLAVGAPGGNGGSVTLEMLGVGPVHLGPTSLVAAGDGANGGNAEARGLRSLGDLAEAIAGTGGNGGNIGIFAPSADVLGKLEIGDSGTGGTAIAMYPNGRTRAVGGTSGEVGLVALPASVSLSILASADALRGGKVGAGGAAVAVSVCASAPNFDSCPSGSGDPNVEQRNGTYGSPGVNATSPGARGGDGGDGGEGYARGGDANATCLFGAPSPTSPGYVCAPYYGNNGGDAEALAGNGGDGGRGGDALRDGSQPIVGGEGGRGGTGGKATAVAGKKACGLAGACGVDGYVTVQSKGGKGGAAGQGGWILEGLGSCDVAGQCWFENGYLCGHGIVGEGGGFESPSIIRDPPNDGYVTDLTANGTAGDAPTYEWPCTHGEAHEDV